ncbi:hypothetical protein ACHQDA_10460 [Vibrio fluvialis]
MDVPKELRDTIGKTEFKNITTHQEPQRRQASVSRSS